MRIIIRKVPLAILIFVVATIQVVYAENISAAPEVAVKNLESAANKILTQSLSNKVSRFAKKMGYQVDREKIEISSNRSGFTAVLPITDSLFNFDLVETTSVAAVYVNHFGTQENLQSESSFYLLQVNENSSGGVTFYLMDENQNVAAEIPAKMETGFAFEENNLPHPSEVDLTPEVTVKLAGSSLGSVVLSLHGVCHNSHWIANCWLTPIPILETVSTISNN